MNVPRYKIILIEQTLKPDPNPPVFDDSEANFTLRPETVIDMQGDAASIGAVAFAIQQRMDAESARDSMAENMASADSRARAEAPRRISRLFGDESQQEGGFSSIFGVADTTDINTEQGAAAGVDIVGAIIGTDGLGALLKLADLAGQGDDPMAIAIRSKLDSSAAPKSRKKSKKR